MIEDRERVRDPEKLSFIIEDKALQALYEIAKRENKSLDEVIGDSLGLRKWALDVRDDGGSIIIRRKREEDTELVI